MDSKTILPAAFCIVHLLSQLFPWNLSWHAAICTFISSFMSAFLMGEINTTLKTVVFWCYVLSRNQLYFLRWSGSWCWYGNVILQMQYQCGIMHPAIILETCWELKWFHKCIQKHSSDFLSFSLKKQKSESAVGEFADLACALLPSEEDHAHTCFHACILSSYDFQEWIHPLPKYLEFIGCIFFQAKILGLHISLSFISPCIYPFICWSTLHSSIHLDLTDRQLRRHRHLEDRKAECRGVTSQRHCRLVTPDLARDIHQNAKTFRPECDEGPVPQTSNFANPQVFPHLMTQIPRKTKKQPIVCPSMWTKKVNNEYECKKATCPLVIFCYASHMIHKTCMRVWTWYFSSRSLMLTNQVIILWTLHIDILFLSVALPTAYICTFS